MPSGEGPLPTKREMHIERQSSALPCREAAQFNEITAANAGKRLAFAGKSRVGLSPRPGVAEFRRSLRREVASTTAERGLVRPLRPTRCTSMTLAPLGRLKRNTSVEDWLESGAIK